MFRLLTILIAALTLSSCDKPPKSAADHELRIVSLSPALTHVLIELGLEHSIVAVGLGDELVQADTPNLGRYVDLNLERLLAVRPTHVLAMTGAAGLPERVEALAADGRYSLTNLPYPNRVDQAIALIAAVGEAVDRPGRGEALARRTAAQLEAIGNLTQAQPQRPAALLLFSTAPLMASGPGTVNDELLHIAGGTNAAAGYAVTAPLLDREALLTLSPQVIVLMSPGDSPLSSEADPRLDALRLPVASDAPSPRVVLLNDPAVLLPGPSMVTTAVSLTVALYPELDERVAEIIRDVP